jgi:hypothetical protein
MAEKKPLVINNGQVGQIQEGDTLENYLHLPGRVGGQEINGGVGENENLDLHSTANETKGKIKLHDKTEIKRTVIFNEDGEQDDDATIIKAIGTIDQEYKTQVNSAWTASTGYTIFALPLQARHSLTLDMRINALADNGEGGALYSVIVSILNDGTNQVSFFHEIASWILNCDITFDIINDVLTVFVSSPAAISWVGTFKWQIIPISE